MQPKMRIQMPQKRNKYAMPQMLFIKWKTEATAPSAVRMPLS